MHDGCPLVTRERDRTIKGRTDLLQGATWRIASIHHVACSSDTPLSTVARGFFRSCWSQVNFMHLVSWPLWGVGWLDETERRG
ncbi:hypothetical protein C0Q70_14377 [Pomacea canaliculata]|uniref:Uncharacterized protein n=1 Tax=Pomacea canaliculata TaxID=400727 RepID=A0A2T7NZV7_POMCA|nr:hypothetical protein C0Q70_14377 [Pomacea canaliculata]